VAHALAAGSLSRQERQAPLRARFSGKLADAQISSPDLGAGHDDGAGLQGPLDAVSDLLHGRS
jgi:hypothetical protein